MGFIGGDMYRGAAVHHMYFRKDPKKKHVDVIINGYCEEQQLLRYPMTPRQFKAFTSGKLSIVPPDCCNPTGRPSVSRYTVLFDGRIKSVMHLAKVFGLDELLKKQRQEARDRKKPPFTY